MITISDHCLDYLKLWLQHTQFLKEFHWITLDKPIKWTDVNKTALLLIDKGFFKSENHQKLFHAYGFFKRYANEIKIAEYEKEKMKISDRWRDVFAALKKEVDCEPLIDLVSFVLTIPG